MIIVKTTNQVHFINESRFEDIIHCTDTNEVVLTDLSRGYSETFVDVKGVLYVSPSNENNIESGTFFTTEQP